MSPIPYYSRSVYGQTRLYVAEIESAQRIARLTGQRTIEPAHLDALTALGLTFNEVLPFSDERHKALQRMAFGER